MWLFSWLFEVVTTPLSIVADVVTLGNCAEDKSFTRQKMEDIDKAFNK